MNLPAFRKTVVIKFWSLRNGIGPNLGVVFDIDTEVERKAYRVKTTNGWKWQIKGFNKNKKWDYFIETDQEILDEYGPEIEAKIFT